MEPLETTEIAEQKPKAAASDRVTLGKNEAEKLNKWIEQASSNSKGFLALTKSDLVNFLIREHKTELSAKELTKLRAGHYDPVKHISWITQELKAALACGDDATVATLQNEIKKIELSPGSRSEGIPSESGSASSAPQSRTRRKRSKKQDGTLAVNESDTKADGQLS